MQWLSISFVCSNISEVIYNHHTPNSLLPCQGRQYSGGGGLSTAFCTLPSIKVLHNLYFSTEGLQLCLSFFSTAPIKGSGRGGLGGYMGPGFTFLLASARQKPVNNRAEFSHFHFHFSQFALSLCLTAICAAMCCSALLWMHPKGTTILWKIIASISLS